MRASSVYSGEGLLRKAGFEQPECHAAALLAYGLEVLQQCTEWVQAAGEVLQRLLGEVTVRCR